MIKRSLCLTVALALGACAGVADFERPITEFAAATDAAASALQGFDAVATRRFNALGIAAAAATPDFIAPLPNNCQTDSPRCVLGLAAMAGDPAPRPITAASLIPNSVRLMGGVQSYAEALDDIVAADGAADVRGGLEKAIGAAATMASTIGLPAGPILDRLSEPLASAGSYLFAQAENRMKREALETATEAADPIIREAMQRLAAEVGIGAAATVARLGAQYNLAFAAVERSERATQAQVAALVAAAAQFDAALALRAANPFAKVASAHAALTADLKSPQTRFATTLAAIEALAVEAQNVRQIVSVLEAAGD